jgi:hypothetical protein
VVDNILNGNKVLRFNSSQRDHLSIGNPSSSGQSSLINTAGQYDSKSIFIVFRVDNAGLSSYQTIFEQGGGARGISIYVRNNTLYFQAWNVPDDDGSANPNLAPWGHQSSNYAITQSSTNLVSGRWYIASFHYQNNMINSPPTNEGLRLYLNGVKEDTYTGNVGRLYTHSGRTAIGCVDNDSFFDDGPLNGQSEVRCFDGDIAEIIYFNEPNTTTVTRMNEPRIQIIHNYLAAKYDITSSNSNLGSNQFFDDAFSDASISGSFFGNDVTGIGQLSGGATHADSRGLTEMRVSSPVWSGANAYLLWGHNGESLTNTWPYSNPGNDLPPGINERSGRVWKFFEGQSGVTNVQIEINYSASNNSTPISLDKTVLRLLTHTNADPNDFSNATVYSPAVSQATGDVVRFSEIPISNGMYLALGNTSTYFTNPLPIELLHFGARLNGEVVDLNWATATETNNDYFVVERASRDLVWEEILTVDGAGNSNTTINYSDVDRNPLYGTSYYRLKQVDYDGSFTYSDVKSVLILDKGGSSESDLTVFPNPTRSGQIFLDVTSDFGTGLTSVSLVNISGQVVWQGTYENMSRLQELNIGDQPAGLYIVQLRNAEKVATSKLVIQD